MVHTRLLRTVRSHRLFTPFVTHLGIGMPQLRADFLDDRNYPWPPWLPRAAGPDVWFFASRTSAAAAGDDGGGAEGGGGAAGVRPVEGRFRHSDVVQDPFSWHWQACV